MQETQTWPDYWDEGIRYLEIVQKAYPVKKTFTPEIIYHMTGMALEKMFMAWLGGVGHLPENHTVRDLVRAADKVEALPEDLRKDLLRFDRFMGLCSLDPVKMPPPQDSDIPAILDIAYRTRIWLDSRVMTALGMRPVA